jgi:hypothetical protein
MLSVADGLALGADLDRFPGRVLLGVVDEGKGHMYFLWLLLALL